jgi:hypothetical protein
MTKSIIAYRLPINIEILKQNQGWEKGLASLRLFLICGQEIINPNPHLIPAWFK